MLNKLVSFSLRFKGAILALALLLLGYGIYAFFQAPYDVFPEFAPPLVEIQTEAPGLSPEQVEVLVTQRIENALNGVAGMDSIRSNSIQGLSVISVALHPGTDIFQDRQAVTERLSTVAGQLPQGVQAPVMSPLTSSTGDLVAIGLTSKKLTLMELRTLADGTVKQRLLAVPGVSKIGIFGGEVREMQIQVHPEKLVKFNLSMENILSAATRATGIRGAGFIDTDQQRILLQSEGQSIKPEELARAVIVYPIAGNLMGNVALGDVATVTLAPAPRISAASIMGEPGIVLNVWTQYGANTLETTRQVDLALQELRPLLDKREVVLTPDLFRAANFIHISLHNIKVSLIIGAILVVLILFLFLLNFRTAAISCTAIPLSLLAAIALMKQWGYSLNVMTLGGLAIAIGEVVDDAVIDVENILRRLRENRRLPNPLPSFEVVLQASLEVRSAVVFATFSVVLVFIPILTLPGLAGRLFAPLGMAYIFAILASLFVALTVTPALCLLLLGKWQLPKQEIAFLRWLKERYRSLLLKIERAPKTVMVFVLLFTLAGLAPLPFFGGEFLPEFREGHFLIHMTGKPGTSLKESLRIGGEITKKMLATPYVRSIAQRVGRASIEDVFGPHSSELEVDLNPLKGEESEKAKSEIRKILDQFPDFTFEVNTFLTERIEETLSGFTASVVMNIFGNDLKVLDKKAEEVVQVLEKIPGASDVRIQSRSGVPQLSIHLRPADLASWGFDPVDVLESIRSAYQGNPVGQIYEGNLAFDVSVILDEHHRQDPAQVGDLPLMSPAGSYVRLRQIADIRQDEGRYEVLHYGARRVQTVTCNVEGRDLQSFVSAAKKEIASVPFPPGAYAGFSGEAEAQAQSERDLIIHSVLAGVGIILLLSFILKRARNLFLVLMNLPFALVGGVLAVFFSKGEISMGSWVGFVTLFGITLRNSIMMISHYEHLVSVEGMSWGSTAAIRGASERLVPILMTALVTAFGLLPLALASGTPGREIEGPMAIVILGGLVSSTLLNLLVLPTLALHYGRFDPE